MAIKQKYAKHDQAATRTMLLRPKTGLKDMIIELDPGTPGTPARRRTATRSRSRNTLPDVNLDEFFAGLDRDTRDYLRLLLAGGGEGLKGQRPRHCRRVLRRFEPLNRDIETHHDAGRASGARTSRA